MTVEEKKNLQANTGYDKCFPFLSLWVQSQEECNNNERTHAYCYPWKWKGVCDSSTRYLVEAERKRGVFPSPGRARRQSLDGSLPVNKLSTLAAFLFHVVAWHAHKAWQTLINSSSDICICICIGCCFPPFPLRCMPIYSTNLRFSSTRWFLRL